MIQINNLIKYLVLFLVTATATKVIPTCGVLKEHAIYVGLTAASTFALIDICYPNYVVTNDQSKR